MRHSRAFLALSGTAALALAAVTLLPVGAQAAGRQPASVSCTETALVAAVNAANSAGGGTITLTAGCTYTLTSAHGNDGSNGPDGLPLITTPITFTGNSDTIIRSSSAPAFRIAQVTSAGSLTLNSLTLSGGDATATGKSNGGGILNSGAVTSTGSTLSGNAALGKGGALENSGIGSAATFTSSTVTSNTAGQGAGIADVNGTLTTTGTVINANTAGSAPGGIYFQAGTITTTTTSTTANSPTNCVGSPSPVPGCIG